MQYRKILLTGWLFALLCPVTLGQQAVQVSGVVTDPSGNPLPGVLVKETASQTGTVSNADGNFTFSGQEGNSYTLVFTFLGYSPHQEAFTLRADHPDLNIMLSESQHDLSEVTVTGKSIIQEIEEKAFNVDVIDAKKLYNTNLDLGHALDRVSGIRVRESGGVGSNMNLSLNGFTGRQVKVFIDGIPMDNFGSSFQLNNIPINLAERIEVYKGVVPVSLGADALGGAINIVTRKSVKSYLDASYSYGSFNTHRTAINAGYVAPSGFTIEMNAFQNYSDNDYKVTVDVADINTGQYYPQQTVKRFNDQYHNETLITQLGVQNKPYADRLLFGITLGKMYKEIQTGARLVSVFGDWHRKGDIIMPTLKYQKDNLFTKGLNVSLNANYNFGTEQNIDTVHRRYNWFQQYREYDTPGGERSYSMYKYQNNNTVAAFSADYAINDVHTLSLSNTFNSFNRQGNDPLFPDQDRYQQPRETMKNILGLGYRYQPNSNASISVFGKQYHQSNYYAKAYNPTGNYGDVAYVNTRDNFDYWGYGLAATYFLNPNVQLKASAEKTYRLPEPEELYGDMVNLEGNIGLRPESSYNYNMGIFYNHAWTVDRRLQVDANFLYRDAKDFIRPRLNTNQAMQVMDNLVNVTNAGFEMDVRYFHGQNFTAGANLTYQNLRNNTRFDEGQTVESVVYRDRIPNMPYLFGNANASYTINDVLGAQKNLVIGYNLLYVHAFYLYWPSLGSDKLDIPKQLSHDLNVTYTFGKQQRFQFTAECRNILDSKLYDNFSLQKPGRNFSGKIRYFIY
ncbi:TonB-dependent receptor [Echinicola vietnamensis]|uniref:Outer membrane receptor protein n=1 Tax=Echinicola vietnamensis (strain DSM 17526 / LMG 23754 / KMM 6221) TaxID=926556 RepID=L0G7A9_ECHVK|nr:TonB-dependent receptor [Echinicola vietnamensis]AGA80740.1 outer membrane receptor protein [Echinicola vietnamensis DSM 17526]